MLLRNQAKIPTAEHDYKSEHHVRVAAFVNTLCSHELSTDLLGEVSAVDAHASSANKRTIMKQKAKTYFQKPNNQYISYSAMDTPFFIS